MLVGQTEKQEGFIFFCLASRQSIGRTDGPFSDPSTPSPLIDVYFFFLLTPAHVPPPRVRNANTMNGIPGSRALSFLKLLSCFERVRARDIYWGGGRGGEAKREVLKLNLRLEDAILGFSAHPLHTSFSHGAMDLHEKKERKWPLSLGEDTIQG